MKFSLNKYLSQKIRFTVSRTNTDEELWHINASRIAVILWTALFLAIFGTLFIFLTLWTPLANYLPGFHGKRSQQEIVKALYKLDSLNNEVSHWETYNDNLVAILEGEKSISEEADSITKSDRKIAPRIILDSILRARIQQDTIYRHYKRTSSNKDLFELLPPAEGIISSSFDPSKGSNGITLSLQPSSMVLSVMDGTIINTSWNPDKGWEITIQHSGGFISIYKDLAGVMQKTGQHVNAGETIGIVHNFGTQSTPELEFELWQNGNIVDPENYINF